ncbi:Hypothetical protein SRAE_X000014300 [Strongyloides ratti]|uniref:Uncharacterized protein n=1 Tax=Strongyloides ratti TaxID=34506 RepID=A0A090N0J8_STRRB|nr:Hypothetical protein SRAE_X000014300 [Strongyloides ratti]CEF70813.2 Hypothetical protein SRAE_X000014300 [Strongyloides ratti]
MNYKINILLVLFINLVSISFLAFSKDAKEEEYDIGPLELSILYAGSERVYNRADLALAKWNRRTKKNLEMCKVVAVSLTRLNDEENDSEYRLLYAATDKKCKWKYIPKLSYKCIKILKAKIRDSGYLSTFELKDSKDYKKFVNVKKLKCYFDM